MDDEITPKDLARQLGVDAKAIRRFLRSKYGVLRRPFVNRWHLTETQVAEVRERFAAK
jgi:hypothetical protein